MLLTKSTEYALRLMLHLINREIESYTPLRQLADELDISFYQLSKVAQRLITAGLLRSYTGPNGGVRPDVDPASTSIADIIQVMEGGLNFRKCVLGLPECGDDNPCAIHHQWADIQNAMLDVFSHRALSELLITG